MKKLDILSMNDAGVFAITANTLDANHAYAVLKFKREGRKAFDSIMDSERAILEEVGITNPPAFDREREQLTKSQENPTRLEELNNTFNRFSELRKALYEEKIELELTPLPYEQFHAIQVENKDLPNKPLNVFEDLLEGVLWIAPEE